METKTYYLKLNVMICGKACLFMIQWANKHQFFKHSVLTPLLSQKKKIL